MRICCAKFTEEVMSADEPLKESILQLKIQSLLRRFDPIHKSLLVDFFYKMNYINVARPEGAPLNLPGANLKDLDLDDVNPDSDQGKARVWCVSALVTFCLFTVALRLNYAQLFLPSTTLINASFQQIDVARANFSASNLIGASFRGSDVSQADFSRATLTLSSFRFANVYQSDFSRVKMQRAGFQNANVSRARFIRSDLSATKFQDISGSYVEFSESELSDAQFDNAELFHARMNSISARSANFYNMRAAQADFSGSYLSSCVFLWANLTGASFRRSFLGGSNFDNADVQNVDFSSAILKGTNLTPGQLNVALSIANAILPDGSRAKNQNLVNNSNADCGGVDNQTSQWNNSGDVFTVGVQGGTNCVFQGRRANATLQQRVDVRRYAALIHREPSRIYIEMQASTPGGSLDAFDPPVYINVRSFSSDDTENGSERK